MKIIVFVAGMLFLLPGLCFSQQKFSLQFESGSLESAISQVRRVTGAVIAYNKSDIEGLRVTAANLKNLSIEQVLDRVLEHQPLILQRNGTTFVVMRTKSPSFPNSPKKDTVIPGTGGLKGVISDESTGQVLSGAGVWLKEIRKGAMADEYGVYDLKNVPPGKYTMEISFVGYTLKTASVSIPGNMDIKLGKTSNSLSEEVVIGYGTIRKKDLTGATSEVRGSELTKMPIPSAAEALTGQMAGVSVTTTDGAPGADVIVRVRGGTSISQDNSPLYIVDGFPSDMALNQISPQDIERIDVLKDASATAIYGSRGANGVVLITTRRGKAGTVAVTYDGYAGIKKFGRKLDVLNPYDYAVYQYERTRGDATGEANFESSYGSWDSLGILYKGQKGVDWQDEVYGRNALQQSHSVAMAGGTTTSQYRLSYTRDDQEGVMLNSSFGRNYFKLNLNQQVTDRLKFSANAVYSESNTRGIQDKGTLKNAVMYRPTYGLKGSNDSLVNLEYDPSISLTNPVTNTSAQYRGKFNKNTILNIALDYTLTKGLTLRLLGGMNRNSDRAESFDNSESSTAIAEGGPFGSINLTDANKISNTALLNYVTTVGKNDFNFLLGQEYIQDNSKALGAGAFQYDNGDIGLNNLSLGNVAAIPTSDVETDKLLSFFGRAFYSYDHKYLLTATLRADGSSKFIDANRWGYFPSAAFAWQAGEEDFVKRWNIFSNLKLRFSYGVAGNDRIDNNAYASTFGAVAYGVSGSSLSVGLIPDNIANPNLKWESTYARNLGIDAGFFNDRLNVGIDLYSNSTHDLLLNAAIPGSSGYTTEFKNIGSTLNKGIETSISSRNISKPGFTWTTNFNITFSRNIITSLNKDFSNNQSSVLESSGWSTDISDFIVKVGQPIGLIYGYVSDGWYKVSDFDYDATAKTYTLKKGQPTISGTTAPQPGDMKFKDLGGQLDPNGNPMLTDDDDRKVIGHTQPKFYGGLNNTFTYKSFDLSIFMNFSVGNQILNANKIAYTTAYYNYQNVLGVMRNRWRTVDDNGNVVTDPAALTALNKNAKLWKWQGGLPRQNYSWAVEDGSFLRINNITMGYTLPRSIISRLHVHNVRVYGTIHNIYTLTGYTGFDPEVSTLRKNPLTPGVDYSAYPKGFSAVGGFNVTF